MNGNGYALWLLTRRNLKIFLKDKANVFFSLLAPLIVLALYVLFLGRIQEDGLLSALEGMGVTGGTAEISAFCDSWMLAGSMSCACITVPLCACGTMIQDKTRGICADLLISPVSKWVTPAAYFLSVVAAGLALGALGIRDLASERFRRLRLYRHTAAFRRRVLRSARIRGGIFPLAGGVHGAQHHSRHRCRVSHRGVYADQLFPGCHSEVYLFHPGELYGGAVPQLHDARRA